MLQKFSTKLYTIEKIIEFGVQCKKKKKIQFETEKLYTIKKIIEFGVQRRKGFQFEILDYKRLPFCKHWSPLGLHQLEICFHLK